MVYANIVHLQTTALLQEIFLLLHGVVGWRMHYNWQPTATQPSPTMQARCFRSNTSLVSVYVFQVGHS